MHLFAYGTLMFPDIWRRVAQREFRSAAASLPGYRIGRVKGETFPAIVRDAPASSVPGLIYFDVDRATIARIDHYESDFYERCCVTALLEDGSEIACDVYALPQRLADDWLDGPWTAQWFEAHGLSRTLSLLSGADRQ